MDNTTHPIPKDSYGVSDAPLASASAGLTVLSTLLNDLDEAPQVARRVRAELNHQNRLVPVGQLV